MNFVKLFLLHAAGSIYETVTGRNYTQRLIRRKISNFIRGESRRSWEDVRTPSKAESNRLNREAARSI